MSAAWDEALTSELARALERAELTLFVKRSGGGVPQPQIAIHYPRGYPEARARAAVFAVAALVSMATPLDEPWSCAAMRPRAVCTSTSMPTLTDGRSSGRSAFCAA